MTVCNLQEKAKPDSKGQRAEPDECRGEAASELLQSQIVELQVQLEAALQRAATGKAQA